LSDWFLAPQLLFQPIEISTQLAHARVPWKKRGGKLGDLAFKRDALLNESLDERRFLRIGQGIGSARVHQFAR